MFATGSGSWQRFFLMYMVMRIVPLFLLLIIWKRLGLAEISRHHASHWRCGTTSVLLLSNFLEPQIRQSWHNAFASIFHRHSPNPYKLVRALLDEQVYFILTLILIKMVAINRVSINRGGADQKIELINSPNQQK